MCGVWWSVCEYEKDAWARFRPACNLVFRKLSKAPSHTPVPESLNTQLQLTESTKLKVWSNPTQKLSLIKLLLWKAPISNCSESKETRFGTGLNMTFQSFSSVLFYALFLVLGCARFQESVFCFCVFTAGSTVRSGRVGPGRGICCRHVTSAPRHATPHLPSPFTRPSLPLPL